MVGMGEGGTRKIKTIVWHGDEKKFAIEEQFRKTTTTHVVAYSHVEKKQEQRETRISFLPFPSYKHAFQYGSMVYR